MSTHIIKSAALFMSCFLMIVFGFASPGVAATQENLVFESASVSIGKSMDADFDAGTNYNCSSIYVSSCTLQRKNASGTWINASTVTPPSDVATNTSNFGAIADYSGSCTTGNTYRIKAVFKAVYGGATYSVTRTSNSVLYK